MREWFDGVAQTLDPDLLNENFIAQTSEVGELPVFVSRMLMSYLISGPNLSKQRMKIGVNYPNLGKVPLNSASIYLGQKNRYELANVRDALVRSCF